MMICAAMMNTGTMRYTAKKLLIDTRPFVYSLNSLKSRNRALEASKAPVSIDRIRPDRVGKVFDRWKDGMNTNGPPNARNK